MLCSPGSERMVPFSHPNAEKKADWVAISFMTD